MKAVILDHDSLAPNDLDFTGLSSSTQLLSSTQLSLPLKWQVYAGTSPDQLDEHMAGATIVLTNKVPISGESMCRHPELRLIQVMATGANNVDLNAARQQGIAVCNCVDYSTASVVQHTFALLLALATRLEDYRDVVRAGNWQKSRFFGLLDFPIEELAGKTIGIVGYGAIGRGVARVAQSFGMQVRVAQSLANTPGRLAVQSSPQRYPLRDLLAEVDVLSLHCPLTEQTRNLIGAQELGLMKPTAWLINVARGGIVDELALAQALIEGRLAGAGVDVLSREPPDDQQILLSPDIPNLLLTPHSAWGSRQARQRLVGQLVEVVAAYCDGNPLPNRLV